MMGTKMNRGRVRIILFLTVLVLTSLLSVYLLSQTKPKKWTVTSHDKTNFPLVGKHRTVSCGECHLAGVLKGTPTECESCHWNRKKDDRYSLQLGIHCGECHTPLDWKKLKPHVWDHEIRTGYRLQGAHRFLDCFSCHQSRQLVPIPQTCVSCHLNDYNNSKDPDHRSAGFSTDCETCHRPDSISWEGASINHDLFWKLQGAHRILDCNECHSQGYNLSTDCYSCHRGDYDGTKDPNHRSSGYSTDCVLCHRVDSTSWEGAVFNHDSVWKLEGAHRTLDCNECHSQGYNLSTECYSCHRGDYDGAKDPDHKASGYSTDCVVCHRSDSTSWEGAVFNHATIWKLEGAHKTLDCNDCHKSGYNLPTDCYGCHRTDYEGTTDPDHQSTGYSTECVDCHLKNHLLWSQAVFNHSFPINSGDHRNLDCSDCHQSSNYKDFTCISCHQHDKNRMDSKHKKVTGYSYDSQACYSCHPQGTE